MNVAITVILIAIFATFGFFVGCSTCLTKIDQLTSQTKILAEWLKASQQANATLAEENKKLLFKLKNTESRQNETKID